MPATARHSAGIYRGTARFFDSSGPLKLSRDLAKIPVERYKLPSDGRKWQHVARERMALAEWLGVHGDGDGSNIFPAVKSMQDHFGWSHGKTCYLLRDLETLGVLLRDGRHGESGPRKRRLIPSALAEQESKIGASTVQDTSNQQSKIDDQQSNVTLDTTVTRPASQADRPSNRQKAEGDSGDAPTDPKTGSAVAASERFRKIPSREDQEPQPTPTLGELFNIAVDEVYLRHPQPVWDDFTLEDEGKTAFAASVTGWVIERPSAAKMEIALFMDAPTSDPRSGNSCRTTKLRRALGSWIASPISQSGTVSSGTRTRGNTLGVS